MVDRMFLSPVNKCYKVSISASSNKLVFGF